MLKNILNCLFLNEFLLFFFLFNENSHSEGKYILCSSLMGDK